MPPMHNYDVMRTKGYSDLKVVNIVEVKYERNFVQFFDPRGLKLSVHSDTITRIERTT